MFRISIKNILVVVIATSLIVVLSSCANLPALKKPTIASKSSAKTAEKTEKTASRIASPFVAKPDFEVDEKTIAAYNAALGEMRDKNYEQAITAMKQVAAMDDRISGPWVNIGMAYKAMGDANNAKTALLQAVKINANNPFALNQLAIMKREDGKFEEAEQLYKQALSTYPDYQNAHLNLAILCDAYLRKIECARDHYQQYLNLTGGNDKQVATWMAQLGKQGS